MSRVRLARSDLKYLLFLEVYSTMKDPKGQRKAFGLIEAAISCYAKKGFSAVTMEMIAREAGVTRPLLRHYFKDANAIRDLSIKYIRLLFQKSAIDALSKGKTPDEMLGLYVEACFDWLQNFKPHTLAWISFLRQCAVNKNLRELNTLASTTGADRIANLIESGAVHGFFKVADAHSAARQIQAIITGSLVMCGSEDVENLKEFRGQIRALCLQAAGAKSAAPLSKV